MLNPAGLYPHSADGSRGPPPHLMLRRSGSGGYDDAPFNFGNQQLFQGGVPGPPGSQQLGSKDQMVPFAASQVVPQSQSQSQSQQQQVQQVQQAQPMQRGQLASSYASHSGGHGRARRRLSQGGSGLTQQQQQRGVA